jgi:hypothetical protein
MDIFRPNDIGDDKSNGDDETDGDDSARSTNNPLTVPSPTAAKGHSIVRLFNGTTISVITYCSNPYGKSCTDALQMFNVTTSVSFAGNAWIGYRKPRGIMANVKSFESERIILSRGS